MLGTVWAIKDVRTIGAHASTMKNERFIRLLNSNWSTNLISQKITSWVSGWTLSRPTGRLWKLRKGGIFTGCDRREHQNRITTNRIAHISFHYSFFTHEFRQAIEAIAVSCNSMILWYEWKTGHLAKIEYISYTFPFNSIVGTDWQCSLTSILTNAMLTVFFAI